MEHKRSRSRNEPRLNDTLVAPYKEYPLEYGIHSLLLPQDLSYVDSDLVRRKKTTINKRLRGSQTRSPLAKY